MYFSNNQQSANRSHATRSGQACQRTKELARSGLHIGKHSSKQSGLTLVELLVVITILMVLLGVVLPLASPSLKSRKIREAARQVNTAFTSAKARAEGTGRPTGLIFDVNPNNPDQVFSIGFAKSPAYFSGAVDGSFATIDPSGFKLRFTTLDASGNIGNDLDSPVLLSSLLGKTPSFLIRFDFRGRWHVGTMTAPGTFVVAPAKGSERAFLDKNTLRRVPYQILMPPKRSAAGKVDLPNGTHADLDHSPVAISTPAGPVATLAAFKALAPATQDPLTPISIVFDKENGLGHIFHGQSVGTIRSSLAVLIVDSEIALDNHELILSPESGSMWVTVNNKSGQIKTSENIGGVGTTEAQQLLSAAKFAISGAKAGGR